MDVRMFANILGWAWLAVAPFAAAEELPIERRVDDRPEALGRVFLYDVRDTPLPDGGVFEGIGRYDPANRSVAFLDPPWVMVRREDQLQQAFAAQPDPLPGAKPAGVYRIRGQLAFNRPELGYHERQRRNLPHFKLRPERWERLDVALTEAAAARRFRRELTRDEDRLEKACAGFNLKYAGLQADGPNFSWHQGRIAVTGVITARPRYSRAAVRYVSASLVMDPARGEPEKWIVVRRVLQSPPD